MAPSTFLGKQFTRAAAAIESDWPLTFSGQQPFFVQFDIGGTRHRFYWRQASEAGIALFAKTKGTPAPDTAFVKVQKQCIIAVKTVSLDLRKCHNLCL